jgi:glucose-6-phosphate 1-dehydrogenase
VTALGAAGLPAGSRIVLEKPFGEDLESAVELNALARQVAGDGVERTVFRVDHVLGMATVQNLLAMRLANRLLDAVWTSAHVEEVEILWEETLALEGRAGYFDGAGTLKDVMQNHMLQILSLVAMEPPASLDERDVRDRKVEALRSVRPLCPDDVASQTRRARYAAGRLTSDDGQEREIPSYVDEEGVDPGRRTETFAEVVLEIDNRRWEGTRFVLRAGKALGRRRKGVVVRFRPLSYVSSTDDGPEVAANELRLGLDGPNEVTLHLNGGVPHPRGALVPLMLTAPPPASRLPAYARVLLDILDGGSTLSVRGDEAEQAWRILTPVLDAWARDQVPLEEYAAGSAGPPPLAHPVASPRSRMSDEAAARA